MLAPGPLPRPFISANVQCGELCLNPWKGVCRSPCRTGAMDFCYELGQTRMSEGLILEYSSCTGLGSLRPSVNLRLQCLLGMRTKVLGGTSRGRKLSLPKV